MEHRRSENQAGRAQLVEELRKRMRLSLQTYREAAAEHDRIIQDAQAQGWKINPDGYQAVRSAASVQRRALGQYVRALGDLTNAVCNSTPEALASPDASESPNPLTPRETQVLVLIVAGLSSREIAARLKISFKTVVVHRSSLMRKLGVHDVVSLVRYALQHKLAEF